MHHRATVILATAVLAVGTLTAAPRQSTSFLPASEVRPGMVGIGRTVFAGENIEEFKVNILGVLHNIIGPGRDLILAKLEGGPLATTGVIAGMSGSPVYINGKLVGAVSYALGQFPKEPFAGITPIGEMIADVDAPAASTRSASTDLGVPVAATPADVFAALRRLMERSASPLSAARSIDPPVDG